MTDEKDPPIIEGEFVEEVTSSKKNAPSKKAKAAKKPSATSRASSGLGNASSTTSKENAKTADAENMKVVSKEKTSFASRLPWVLVGILVIFTTGLFAEPFAERGIRKFFPNLLPAPEAGTELAGLSEVDSATMTNLQTGLDGLTRRLVVVEQALNSLDIEAKARDKRLDEMPINTSGAAGASSNVAISLIKDVADIKTGIKSLNDQLAVLNGRLATVETGTGEQTTTLTGMKTSIDALTVKQQSIETALLNTATGSGVSDEALASVMATIQALNSRLQQLESAQSATSLTQGLAVTAARLSTKAMSGAAYGDELLALEVLVADGPAMLRARLSPSLEILRQSAYKGYASQATMREDLILHGSEALKVATTKPEDKSWYSDTLDSISSLISVRRTDVVEGNSNEARINRALLALKADDLVLAVTEIDQLTPGARKVVEPWLVMAGDRVAGQMALQTIMTESLKPLRQLEDGGQ
jgi:hypothetical protein